MSTVQIVNNHSGLSIKNQLISHIKNPATELEQGLLISKLLFD